jgi:spermidine synthase
LGVRTLRDQLPRIFQSEAYEDECPFARRADPADGIPLVAGCAEGRAVGPEPAQEEICMIPWSQHGTANIPGGGGQLRLMQRGAEFSIMLGDVELMNSRVSGSEEALATLACRRIKDRRRPDVLIGGLGMGFTLRAALAELHPDARVVVSELIPEVVAWARGPMAEVFGRSLADPRVSIREGDVVPLIRSARLVYDAILLDVDNGPEGLTREANDRLYDAQGLSAARTALRPGGVLAVWSSAPDGSFVRRLRQAGFGVEEVGVRANRGRRGARHVIWLATKPAS